MGFVRSRSLILVIVIAVALFVPRQAAAHCDTVDGPVVTTAKLALKSGDVTPLLKWVRPQDEEQIRAAFARTLKVRTLGPEAQELADTYFFETLVRVHRSGEGEPFTGLKPAGTEVEPGIALADKALETGSADALVGQITNEVGRNIRQRLARVQEAGKNADRDVESGRAYVAAYVDFIHYVERMHQALTKSHGNHEVQTAELPSHKHE